MQSDLHSSTDVALIQAFQSSKHPLVPISEFLLYSIYTGVSLSCAARQAGFIHVHGKMIASFPGFSTVQFLITYSMQKQKGKGACSMQWEDLGTRLVNQSYLIAHLY